MNIKVIFIDRVSALSVGVYWNQYQLWGMSSNAVDDVAEIAADDTSFCAIARG